MKIKARSRNDEARPWFAWYPVLVTESNTWVWLERVIRRPEYAEGWRFWYYRLPDPTSGQEEKP